MRHVLSALALVGSALLAVSCQGGGSPATPTAPAATATNPDITTPNAPPPDVLDLAGLPQLADEHGMAGGVLGVYYLQRDPADPTQVELTMPRVGQAKTQGDLFALALRPFMSILDLIVLGSSAGPNNTTDYIFRFTHPFDMPTNLDPPQSAAKRVDLFVFDTTLLVGADGAETFFGGEVRTNTSAVPNADGYRTVGPLFDPTTLNIATANTFPYKLLANINPGNPTGNYDAESGWTGTEYLNPSGYDVIPQGGQAEVSIRLSNDLPNDPLPLIVLAKYMDPRNGNIAFDKRQNRLPSADPTGLRYFLPEAAGDLQKITANVSGQLLDTNDTDLVTVSATVQDWDATATTSVLFPDHDNVTHIAERSGIQDAQISVPLLKAAGVFNASSITPIPAATPQFLALEFKVNNADKTFHAPVEGATLPGMIRLRDQQDFSLPTQLLLDEDLIVVTPPAGYLPSTRYLPIQIAIGRGLKSPLIESIEPLQGIQGEDVTLTVTASGDPIDAWDWAMTFDFDPTVSTAENPTFRLLAPGSHRCAVTVSNAAGSDSKYFQFEVLPPPPSLTAVTPASIWEGESAIFSATNTGGPVATWSWDFSGGTNPATSTDPQPDVTALRPGSYTASVSATNVSGESTFPFTYTVLPALPPEVTSVAPDYIYGRQPAAFSAIMDPAAGIVESWEWDFGGGCTPNTSTAAMPAVKAGMPGAFTGKLIVTNRFGSTEYDFPYEIRIREFAMTVHVIKSTSGNFPTKWWNLANWNRNDVAAWFDTYVNPIFAPAAVRIDPARLELNIITDRPELYNLDNGTENTALFDLLYFGGDYSRLNYWCINRNNYSGWAGVMDDYFCDYTNDRRGCIGISYTTQYAQKVAAHELGHVFNLPHTRTNTNPITSLNNNLMGYGNGNVTMLENVFVETPGGCQIWAGNPLSQYQVVSDWWNQYSQIP